MEKDLVSDVRARLSIEDVIGGYINLKPSGQGYKALSPFKDEKTPSLVVTPAKDIWKDFSSGKGGDMFTFVMEHEGVDFREALNILAEKAGLNPADYRPSRNANTNEHQKIKKSVLDVLEQAASFYEDQLIKSSKAQSYIKTRGFNTETVTKFRFGYAPSSWEAFAQYCQSHKISIQTATLAGLILTRPIPEWLKEKTKTEETEKLGDFFADRLLIPLSDPGGKIIGFTGRVLSSRDKGGKYINSKQTVVYNKSKHVFGYFQAKDAIRKEGYALVVEGNLDVVACHQAGWSQTVAAGGTALTLDHLKIISRLTSDVRLAFDGDSAGVSAMERSIIMAVQAKVNLSVIDLPLGSDPDDLLRSNKSLFAKLVNDHQPALDWLYNKYCHQFNIKTAQGKKQLTDLILPLISQLEDAIEAEHYLNKLADDLQISRTALNKKLDKLAGVKIEASLRLTPNQDTTDSQPIVNPGRFNTDSKIDLLLGYLLIEPKLRDLDETKVDRLLTILQKFDRQLLMFTSLQQLKVKITDVDKLPSQLQSLRENVRISLEVIGKATPRGDFSDDFSVNKLAFEDLYRQLDIMQSKVERQTS